MSDGNTKINHKALCKFNEEFIETLNDLKLKKKKIMKKLNKEKKELVGIQKELDNHNNKKASLESSIRKKTKQLETVDTTIKNTQSAYEKIVETSQVLLTVIKKQKRDTKD
jgi:sjoegren syndrome nuclear autoantigen 1|tara:strand:+ start:1365 stop:1697 length:333 start_codon:yes stop_codon:yes gene_type:complete